VQRTELTRGGLSLANLQTRKPGQLLPSLLARPEEFRTVTRAHLIAWRDDLMRRELGGSTIRQDLF
jgi:hypothetical protein